MLITEGSAYSLFDIGTMTLHIPLPARLSHVAAPILAFLAMFTASKAVAQLGLKLVQFRPTAELGEVMERKVSAELLYLPDFEANWRSRFFVSYYELEPRLAAFPITGYEYRDGVWTVFPGTQSYTKYNLILFGGGMDYGGLHLMDDKLTIYPGADIFGGGVDQEYETDVPGLSSSGFSGGFMLAGLRARIGADYSFSEVVSVFTEWSTATYWLQESGRFTFNDIGVGARFIF